MITVAEPTIIVDWNRVETRQTANGYELLCPECKRWVAALLTTAAGIMCAGCWKRKGSG